MFYVICGKKIDNIVFNNNILYITTINNNSNFDLENKKFNWLTR